MKVLVADDIAVAGLAALTEMTEVELVFKTGLPEDALVEEIRDADALLVRSQTKVTERILNTAEHLKVVGRAGVGVDNIDVKAATRRGIVVVNAPDGNTISAAEHTMAMMLASARNLPQAHMSVREGEWNRKAFLGVELRGKTLGIVGFGRIGTDVARRAQAFGMEIFAYDPFLTPERAQQLGVKAGSFEEVIQAADVITVHTPLIKETRHLLDAAAFQHMKDGVRIVNCARGGIIDESALAKALQSGKVASAALDVYEEEPLPADHPLRSFTNVVFTPHIAASTEEAQESVAVIVAEEVARILRDEPFYNAVNLPSLSKEQKAILNPYMVLCEQLGSFLGQVLDSPSGEVEFRSAGEIAAQDVSYLTRTFLKGLLQHRYADEVNYVNAPTLAADSGWQVKEIKQPKGGDYTNLISVSARTSTGQQTVSGTLYNGTDPRIVAINDYRVDATPEGRMLYTIHNDRPGMIGRIGMLLGAAEINIGSMQVGRKDTGGEAVMLLTVDRMIPSDIIDRVREIDGIIDVRSIEL